MMFLQSIQTIPLLLLVAGLGLGLGLAAVRLFDRACWPDVAFGRELKAGNVAVAIVVAAIILGIFHLVAQAVA